MYLKKGRAFHLLLSAHLAAAIILMAGAAQATDVGAQFVHMVTVENVAGGFSRIDHPLTNSDQSAIIHVTHSYNTCGAGSITNDHVVGVAYSDFDAQWMIVNHDVSTASIGAAFNIWVPPADAATFIHTATAANITNNSTTIDNPLTNGDPGAILRVTQNANPAGTAWIFNDHVVGVMYDGSKWAIFNQDLAAMPDGSSFNVTVLPDDPTVSVHTASPASTVGNWTSVDHPLTNNNPNAIVSITQSWNPGGGGGVYNDHVVGVWYNYEFEKWAVFNQDGIAMPTGASFNVSAPSLESAFFAHTADLGNIAGPTTTIDHPLTNNNPNAIVLLTQSWNPGGAGGTDNDHRLAVWYNPIDSKWTVVNQDYAAMPEGASFNVSIPAVDALTFVHEATAGNSTLNWTTIDHPLMSDYSNTIIHATQSWNPSGVSSTYNNHTIGVWYDATDSRWAVFNQDISSMPEGATFNISIPAVGTETFVHTADSTNTTGNYTVIHHPLTDGNPFALVQVTQNWNPPGSARVYNDHSISVWYTGEHHWSIFNQDGAAMPVGAAFNITVVDPPLFSDGFESGNTSAWSAAVP